MLLLRERAVCLLLALSWQMAQAFAPPRAAAIASPTPSPPSDGRRRTTTDVLVARQDLSDADVAWVDNDGDDDEEEEDEMPAKKKTSRWDRLNKRIKERIIKEGQERAIANKKKREPAQDKKRRKLPDEPFQWYIADPPLLLPSDSE